MRHKTVGNNALRRQRHQVYCFTSQPLNIPYLCCDTQRYKGSARCVVRRARAKPPPRDCAILVEHNRYSQEDSRVRLNGKFMDWQHCNHADQTSHSHCEATMPVCGGSKSANRCGMSMQNSRRSSMHVHKLASNFDTRVNRSHWTTGTTQCTVPL